MDVSEKSQLQIVSVPWINTPDGLATTAYISVLSVRCKQYNNIADEKQYYTAVVTKPLISIKNLGYKADYRQL